MPSRIHVSGLDDIWISSSLNTENVVLLTPLALAYQQLWWSSGLFILGTLDRPTVCVNLPSLCLRKSLSHCFVTPGTEDKRSLATPLSVHVADS
jgi:hypothetical protein